MHKNGQVATVNTPMANKDCHVILRGGKAPNYDAASRGCCPQGPEAAKLPATLMVDRSHANSSKQHESSWTWRATLHSQIAGGSHSVFGVMTGSHINAGAEVHPRQR